MCENRTLSTLSPRLVEDIRPCMKLTRPVIASLFLFTIAYCNKGKPRTTATTSAAVVSETCPDLDPKIALMRCNGNNLEYCSSFSKFKWLEAQKCPAEKNCFVAPDGKAGGCR